MKINRSDKPRKEVARKVTFKIQPHIHNTILLQTQLPVVVSYLQVGLSHTKHIRHQITITQNKISNSLDNGGLQNLPEPLAAPHFQLLPRCYQLAPLQWDLGSDRP